jgi:hypothetical protein
MFFPAVSRFFKTFQSQIDLYKEVSARPPLDKLIKALVAVNTSRRAQLGIHHGSSSPTTTSLELQRSIRELISPTTPDRVFVQKSTIPKSGVGLFAAEKLLLGTVVCIYPGKIFSKFASPPQADSFSDAGAYYEESLEPPSNSMYVLIRAPDGGSVKIDAGDLETHSKEFATIVDTCGMNASSGHLVNHPPLGTSPNVIDVAVDIPILEQHEGGDTFIDKHNGRLGKTPYHVLPWSLVHRFPLWWAGAEVIEDDEEGTGIGRRELKSGILTGLLPPLSDEDFKNEPFFTSDDTAGTKPSLTRFKRSCQVPAICFVALTDIEKGSELFLDYSYYGGELPSWYSPVTSEMRWRNYENVLSLLKNTS